MEEAVVAVEGKRRWRWWWWWWCEGWRSWSWRCLGGGGGGGGGGGRWKQERIQSEDVMQAGVSWSAAAPPELLMT